MKKSRIVGIIGALLLLVIIYSLQQQTSPGEYTYDHPLLLTVVMMMWLVLVAMTMIGLVLGKWYRMFAILSVILFVVILILAHFWVHCITPYERPFIYENLALFSLCGFVIICEFIVLFWFGKKET